MSKKGISRDELPGVQGWLQGVLWDVRHGYSAHAGQTLIALIKGIQERTEVPCNFEGWPEEAVAKIDPFTFNPYR